MSHHYSGPDFGFPHGDALLDLTDLYAFPKPGEEINPYYERASVRRLQPDRVHHRSSAAKRRTYTGRPIRRIRF
jgi:hypothetical protein